MPDHRVGNNWKYLLENFFILGITRRDLVAQIASFYICDKTRIWHNKKNFEINMPVWVDIDNDSIENQCRYILDQQLKYQQLTQHCEVELIYEEIQHEFVKSDYDQYPKPTNYTQIKSCIEQFLIQETTGQHHA
jgi:LPS sulfotransferase NodH